MEERGAATYLSTYDFCSFSTEASRDEEAGAGCGYGDGEFVKPWLVLMETYRYKTELLDPSIKRPV
jgi:hypothetical protein